jgi:hypothetical protein
MKGGSTSYFIKDGSKSLGIGIQVQIPNCLQSNAMELSVTGKGSKEQLSQNYEIIENKHSKHFRIKV